MKKYRSVEWKEVIGASYDPEGLVQVLAFLR
jgi:hypothetical protein